LIRILTLSSLFPDASRPVFGPFVERQTLGIAAHPEVELQVVAPLGIPPWPIGLHPCYAALRKLPDQEVWKGVLVHRPRFGHIPATGGRYDPAMMVRALKPMLTALRQTFPFDVIDAQFFFPDGPAAVALGAHFGVPVSIKARGGDINFWGSQPATRTLVAHAGQRATGLLAVSDAIKHEMVSLGMEEAKIKVHYTGVDLERFQPLDRTKTKVELKVAGPLVACVGALIPLKGQAVLIEALTNLSGVTLAIIGKGQEDAALKAFATERGVADRCIFTGSLPQEKIAQWLGAADVMALATSSEGLANVWVEALASGTPVVTCDVGGAREIIDQPAAGLLAERTADAFAIAIKTLLNNPIDQNAARACAERFTWARNTQTLFDHLSDLCTVRVAPGDPFATARC
jgi:teichuronic acid biosynthesis glycosyltransferase TuaC